jgi:YfiH family protein
VKAEPGTVVLEQPRHWGDVSGLEVPEWRVQHGFVAGITDRERDFKLPAQGSGGALDGLLAALNDGFEQLIVSRQVHGARVHRHARDEAGVRQVEGHDGHVTTTPGVLLAVTVADCVPVYLAHPASGAVALLHAGWRGLAAGVLEAGISFLCEAGAAPAGDIVMHCGVAICGDCYEVGPEVIAAVGSESAGGRARLDMRAALVERAQRLGIEQVTVSGWCTAHHRDRFHSHRASGSAAGRQVAFLGRPVP